MKPTAETPVDQLPWVEITHCVQDLMWDAVIGQYHKHSFRNFALMQEAHDGLLETLRSLAENLGYRLEPITAHQPEEK